ncbi:hypothetical protein [Paenibacillus sp. Mc5Re-14]|uniref:hypothetical protein n=1 Tax=Paenibacillus sp. Mc5Re-14 TaxID=1030529 RepID=UPI000A540184|nr:hypothetical protein [Paenibacillus sp. Mc5Re-14]
MKIKLSVTIEINEKDYPNLSKEEIKNHFQGNFDLYMQQVEAETKNLLKDISTSK